MAHSPEHEAAAPELSLEDDAGEQLRRLGVKAVLKGGYDPYDRDPLKRKKKLESAHQNTDLRKLSEWIRLKREVEELKNQEAAAERKK